MDHALFLYLEDKFAQVNDRLDQMLAALNRATTERKNIMATLQDILDDEAQESTALGQLATAIQTLQQGVTTLQQQLRDALSGVTLPPAVQAQVDAALAASKANLDNVNAILTSLAPPTPAP